MLALAGAVALLAEGVDRNWKAYPKKTGKQVALLAEGVDRNSTFQLTDNNKRVALLAEGVDRNPLCVFDLRGVVRRPPRGGRG